MASKEVKYYQVPDKYWYRIHFVRPRFKSNIENVLLYMANECCRIPKCSCEEYNSRYFNAIKMFPGNIDMADKTLHNWRTEIPALFGFYKENKDLDITETSKMAFFLHENQDLTQFLRLFLFSKIVCATWSAVTFPLVTRTSLKMQYVASSADIDISFSLPISPNNRLPDIST